jgi:hypothetical protein
MPPPPALCVEPESASEVGAPCNVTDDCLWGFDTPCNIKKCVPHVGGSKCEYVDDFAGGKPCGTATYKGQNYEFKCSAERLCCASGI